MSSAADNARVGACKRQVCKYFIDMSEGVFEKFSNDYAQSVQAVSLYKELISALKLGELNDTTFEIAKSLNSSAWREYRTSGAEDKYFWGDIVACTHTTMACVLLGAGPPGCLQAMHHIDSVLILRGFIGPLRSMCGYAEPKAKQAARMLREREDTTHTQNLSDDSDKILHGDPTKLVYMSPPESVMPLSDGGEPVETISIACDYAVSYSTFKAHVKQNCPLVMSGGQSDWGAVETWTDLDHLLGSMGHRWIPGELGVHGSAGWKEEIVEMSAFIRDYIRPSHLLTLTGQKTPDERVGYIAQHELFDHIPSLKLDFKVPQFIKDLIGGHPEKMNGWFGTAGTITPLHTDTYENILAQVAGYKYLRLYAPDQTHRLYNYLSEGSNISPVQCEHEDYEKHPLAKEARYIDLILRPGDMLYIPVGTWHYVRSLTPSFSINFWW